jgi:hypothetical protein
VLGELPRTSRRTSACSARSAPRVP